jgi:4-methylaminobutanoate oxidase (formaldehyde-forming)
VHSRHVEAGAHFRDVSGWESPDWFAGPGVVADPGPLTWGRASWFGQWAAEHRACREGVVLMDMSFMAKLLVQGRDAGAVLDHLSANHVDAADGRITYTQWLNASGTLEADLTVTKLGPEQFWVVASDTAHRHVLSRVQRALGSDRFADAHASVTDVTGGYAQLNVQGPRSRDLLQSLTSADLSNSAFPFRTARTIDLGYAEVLCVRITYLGELGYELYVPAEHALDVYDRIRSAGAAFGLRLAGLKALASLRMEKGYRDYGHDIDNTDTVDEAGLGFAVALTRRDESGAAVEREFVGRDAVLRQRASYEATGGVPSNRLVQVLLSDPEPLMYHAEVLRRNGAEVGYLRAASYGHTLGAAVGLAMVEPGPRSLTRPGEEPVVITQDWLDGGAWDVEIAGTRHPASCSLTALYDPKNLRIRA